MAGSLVLSVDGVVEELEHLPKRNPYRRGRKARQGSSGQDLNIMQEDPQPRVIFNSYSCGYSINSQLMQVCLTFMKWPHGSILFLTTFQILFCSNRMTRVFQFVLRHNIFEWIFDDMITDSSIFEYFKIPNKCGYPPNKLHFFIFIVNRLPHESYF